jgi:hypothetical protein
VGSPFDPFGGQLGEPSFHHVEPGSRRGREMRVEAGVAQQPAVDLGRFMGGIVVELCRCPHSSTYADTAIMPTRGVREGRSPSGTGVVGGERAGGVGIIAVG